MSDEAIGPWVLFCVTRGGHVSSAGFPTREMAEDAESVALTGRTPAENKKAAEDAAAAEADWYAQHPPRPPDGKDEAAKAATLGLLWQDKRGSVHCVADGNLIQDKPPWVWLYYRTSRSYEDRKSDIKTARVFLNPDWPS